MFVGMRGDEAALDECMPSLLDEDDDDDSRREERARSLSQSTKRRDLGYRHRKKARQTRT